MLPMSYEDLSNRELVAAIADKLTHGFYVVTPFGEVMSPNLTKSRLEETKPWRTELWNLFREVDARLVPKPSPKPQRQKELPLDQSD
jgi:hypothetical protein